MMSDVTFHPEWWHRKAGIDFSRPFFDDSSIRIEADKMMRRGLFDRFGAWGIGEENPQDRPILGSDYIASGYLFSEVLGCDIRFSTDSPPEVICAEWDGSLSMYQAPSLEDSDVWVRLEDQIARLKSRYGAVCNAVNLQGVLNLALDLRGQQIMMDFYLDPEGTRHFLGEIHRVLSAGIDRLLEVSRGVFSGGVTAVTRQWIPERLVVHSNCSIEMISNETYEDFLLEYDSLMAAAFPAYGIHHCGGTMEHVAAGYAKVAGMIFAEVGAGSDIASVRNALPGVGLNLRYSPVRLAAVDESDLKRELAEMLRQAAGDAPVSISCVGIGDDVSDSQVEMFLEICRSAGE